MMENSVHGEKLLSATRSSASPLTRAQGENGPGENGQGAVAACALLPNSSFPAGDLGKADLHTIRSLSNRQAHKALYGIIRFGGKDSIIRRQKLMIWYTIVYASLEAGVKRQARDL